MVHESIVLLNNNLTHFSAPTHCCTKTAVILARESIVVLNNKISILEHEHIVVKNNRLKHSGERKYTCTKKIG
jgi:hypothetical protein